MKYTIAAMAFGAIVLTAGADEEEQWIKGKVDYTYASRYVTHGFNVGDTPAHQPSIGLSSDKLPGFSFLLWTSLTVDRDKKLKDEWDFMFFYNRTIMEDHPWAIAMSTYYDYWFYPNNEQPGGKDLQGHKFHIGGTLPNLIPMPEGFSLVPGYNYYFWTPVTDDQFTRGGSHELPLTLEIPLPLPEATAVPQSINLKGTINYSAGYFDVETGWSHATASIGTGAPIWEMISWHASLDYQWTFTDTLNGNDDNIFWGTLGVNAEF